MVKLDRQYPDHSKSDPAGSTRAHEISTPSQGRGRGPDPVYQEAYMTQTIDQYQIGGRHLA
jgi:hypothetical protein